MFARLSGSHRCICGLANAWGARESETGHEPLDGLCTRPQIAKKIPCAMGGHEQAREGPDVMPNPLFEAAERVIADRSAELQLYRRITRQPGVSSAHLRELERHAAAFILGRRDEFCDYPGMGGGIEERICQVVCTCLEIGLDLGQLQLFEQVIEAT